MSDGRAVANSAWSRFYFNGRNMIPLLLASFLEFFLAVSVAPERKTFRVA